jgi:transcriptional regulator GlxA family with amidase domain
VLSRLPDAQVTFLAADGEPGERRTENGMLALSADRSLEDMPSPDVIVVPGGFGTRALMEHLRFLDWLRNAHELSTWTTSVCTGSLVLAAAGLLDGVEATTHWLLLGRLGELGARPVSDRRIVQTGRIITAAGVSAGVDMAIALAAEIAGADTAEAIQLGIEYAPEPPFAGGSTHTARPEIIAMVRDNPRFA